MVLITLYLTCKLVLPYKEAEFTLVYTCCSYKIVETLYWTLLSLNSCAPDTTYARKLSLCHIISLFAGKRRPTQRDLLVAQKKDGSKLKIIFEITSHGATASRDLATLLLGDDSVVRKLRNKCKDDNDAFVREVFDTWLNQDDDDSTRSTTPCTWDKLCSCVEDTDGLPGSLAKEIRNQFCS